LPVEITRVQDPDVDVTVATFERDVIEHSRKVPVIVVFWSVMDDPGRNLVRLAEPEVERRAGAIVLAKVETKANPELAEAWNVRRYPTVKAFRGGEVVAEFVGPRSATDFTLFVDEVLAPPERAAAMRLIREADDHPAFPEAFKDLDLEEVARLVLNQIESYRYEEPEDVSGLLGQPWSKERVEAELAKMRAGLVKPEWRIVEDGYAWDTKPKRRHCVLVAVDPHPAGYAELYYDPTEKGFVLADAGDPPRVETFRGVSDDAVEMFMGSCM
jgi:hypothetical protein